MNPKRKQVTLDGLRSEEPETQPSPSSSDPPQPQVCDGFTVHTPNESRRRQMIQMSLEEEENLQRLRDRNRVSHVHTDPEKLGGHRTMAEVRQEKQTRQRSSKLQKKLKQEEEERRRKKEEEEALQEKMDQQRKKSERLQERRRQDDHKRELDLRQDYNWRQESFLQRIETTATPVPLASRRDSHTHTPSRSDSVERKPKMSLSEVQLDQRRVNSAFLDKMEARGGGGGVQRAEPNCMSSSLSGRHSGSTHMEAEPELSWTQETESYLDYDAVLRKLMSDFPQCSRIFMEDIVNQCHGDYELAYSLLC